jgi:hypothetical protein
MWKKPQIPSGTMRFFINSFREVVIFFPARIIHSILSGRTFQVSVGKSKSSVCNIPYGVPQSAVLFPTLYNLFTMDALTAEGCKLATFADNTAIFGSYSEPMNVCDGFKSQLQSLTDYFEQWKIKVNASKKRPFISLDASLQGDFLSLELYLTARKCHGLWSLNIWE